MRTRIFGLGLPKSGTHSLAAVFRNAGVPTLHEPGIETLAAAHQESHAYVEQVLCDQASQCEVNVSSINGELVDPLYRLFPEARYVLMLRPLPDWIVSIVTYHLCTQNTTLGWHYWKRRRFSGYVYADEDKALPVTPCYPLRSYFEYWNRTVNRILVGIPSSQLLVIPLQEFEDRLPQLASFAKIAGQLKVVHEFRGKSPLVVPAAILDGVIRDLALSVCHKAVSKLREHHIEPRSVLGRWGDENADANVAGLLSKSALA